jgi:hypothetical protein
MEDPAVTLRQRRETGRTWQHFFTVVHQDCWWYGERWLTGTPVSGVVFVVWVVPGV